MWIKIHYNKWLCCLYHMLYYDFTIYVLTLKCHFDSQIPSGLSPLCLVVLLPCDTRVNVIMMV
jgi:hypothetical protein